MSPSESPDDLISVNQAATMLGVSATTVRNWAAEGRLTEQRTTGGHRRFRRGDVADLARDVRVPSRPLALVIDDDDAIRFIVREALTMAGMDVVEASSGLLGLAAVDRRAPDVVLLDIMMPDLDGLKVMQQLAQFGVPVPVIAMSALGERVKERTRELGARTFIAKPFDVARLVELCVETARTKPSPRA